MQPTAFRRVLKSLSPRKRNLHKRTDSQESHHDPPSSTSQTSSSPPSEIDESIHDQQSDLPSSATLSENKHVEQPQRQPPNTWSRMHRRAMRDVTLTHILDQNPVQQPRRMPPMHLNVDPTTVFVEWERIGNGASGVVFFAKRKMGRDVVALKKVTPSTATKSRMLENEIRTMHGIRHPNIVQCHEAYSWEGSVWIVMEAMDVGCLTHVLDFLRRKHYLLSEPHIAYILRETLQGLWAMHSQKRLHRDIKSDNVLVASDGQIKLADFEYTAVLTEESPKRNTVVGTAWWMSPETVRSSFYDYGADVWSIGILSVECAEWVPPLFGMDSAQAMEVIRDGQLTQGFKRPDMWSVDFADFVRGCLTRDRNQRYTVPDLLTHPFLEKACTKTQIANVFRAVRGMEPILDDE